MYQAPDFIKVSTKAEDVYANYSTGCMPDGRYYYEQAVAATCLDLGPFVDDVVATYSGGIQCYSTLNP